MSSPRRIALARWTPDAPPLESEGLLVAINSVPFPGGRMPYPSPVALSLGSLAAYCRGGIGTADRDGVSENFAGDGTKLYRVQSSALTDISKVGGYTTDKRWEFSVFVAATTGQRPLVLATNFVDPVQVYEIGISALFANLTAAVADPGAGPPVAGAPRARHMGVIGDFLVLGDIYNTTDGHVQTGFWWSAIGNATSWPVPGTDVAVSAQSGRATIPGEGGAITRVVGGSEGGLLFQETAVHRLDYVGGEVVFERHRCDGDRGSPFHHMVWPIGRRALFWSGDGFYLNDGTESIPVGNGVLDAFFKRDLQTDFVDRSSYLFDPSGPRILIGYAGAGNNGGRPNRVIVFDFAQREWGLLEFEHDCLVRVKNPGADLTMDRMPSPIPDLLDGGWDDTFSGAAFPGLYDENHQLATFTGQSLPAILETGDLELNPGRRAQVQGARPVVGSVDLALQLSRRGRYADTPAYTAASGMRDSGFVPLRGDGRFHRVRMLLPSGWAGPAHVLDIDYRASGGR